MLTVQRQRGLTVLHTVSKDFDTIRKVESLCHSLSANVTDYLDNIKRCAFNLKENPCLDSSVVCSSDHSMTENTLVGRIEQNRIERNNRFEKMLQEKYESMNDESIGSLIRCRRCGSTEVTWEEKQTRSADEAATLFCSCSTCKNRWVVR